MRASVSELGVIGGVSSCDCDGGSHQLKPSSGTNGRVLLKKSFNGDSPTYTIRNTIEQEIHNHVSELIDLSLYIYSNPELLYQEFKAHAKLSEFLSNRGFKVENYANIPTAFRVSYTHGEGGRTFGLNSEYDALPGVGHACGHNLIAVSGVAGLLSMKAAMQAYDIPGTVVLLGTPAEEGGGGKIKLLDAGAYKDLDACMMLHPGPGSYGPGGIGPSLARQRITIDFHGKPAHAAASPWEGVNALDAAVGAYVGIATLRQQLQPTTRLHSVISEGGGQAVNVIPAHAQMQCAVRAQTSGAVEATVTKIMNCVEGAARMAGCTVKFDFSEMYKDLVNVKGLAHEYASTMNDMYGYEIRTIFDSAQGIGASTDFGNVTYALPACHPGFGIPCPPKGGCHTPEFAGAASTPEAFAETWKASAAMAWCGVRFLMDDAFAAKVRNDFEDDQNRIAQAVKEL
ncbi:hypothetical protein V866_002108 [Kwoniella sp. B9012]